MDKYNYKKIEEKWQKKWEENKVFNASQNKKATVKNKKPVNKSMLPTLGVLTKKVNIFLKI